MSQGETAWISTAVSLVSGSFLLLGGRLADLYGRKLVLVTSFTLAAIWSIVAGFAHNKYFPLLPNPKIKWYRYLFFVARGFQGLGAAGAIPASLGILGANYGPGRRKNRVFAAFSAGNPVGAAFGLVIGGILTNYASWRWICWLIGIIEALAAIGSLFVMPKDVKRDKGKEKIDVIGAILVTCGLTLFCFGLTYLILMSEIDCRDGDNAPNQWKTWYIIFCLIMGFVLCVVFIFVESKMPSPLMPLSIWRVPQFGKLMLCFGLGFGAFAGSIIFGYSLYFQQIYQASPITVYPSSVVILIM